MLDVKVDTHMYVPPEGTGSAGEETFGVVLDKLVSDPEPASQATWLV